jgi:glutathione S-transferase
VGSGHAPLIRLYRFPLSTNVERVALALAHKKLPVESVVIDPADRSDVRRLSGQDLVPVIEDGGTVVSDSMEIVRYLEEHYPEHPLYPADPARRAEMLVFIDWFNRVWKRPPNEIEAELGKPDPARDRIERLGRSMADALELFEGMLAGRDYLMGEFSAADCAAFPFLKYALFGEEQLRRDQDSHLFHKILVDYQPLGDAHPNLVGWIRRMDRRSRA